MIRVGTLESGSVRSVGSAELLPTVRRPAETSTRGCPRPPTSSPGNCSMFTFRSGMWTTWPTKPETGAPKPANEMTAPSC